MENHPFCKHIEFCFSIDRNQIHAHNGLVPWTKRIHNECAARIECKSSERHLLIFNRLNIADTFSDRMKPVCNLIIRFVLAGNVKILVQLLQLPLHTPTPRLIIGWLCQEIPILEINRLSRMVFLYFVKNVLTDFLCTVQNRLHTAPIPIKELLLEHVRHVINQSRIQFL